MIKLNTIQKIEKLNDVYTLDSRDIGGAHHKYLISKGSNIFAEIQMQKGPRRDDNSTNGVIDSDLLEIVRHRLQCFQEGPCKCDCNAKALEYIELALMYMNRRVEDRIERNVLGTYDK